MTQQQAQDNKKAEEALMAEATAYAARISKDPAKASPLIIEAYIAGHKSGYRSASAAALKALKQ